VLSTVRLASEFCMTHILCACLAVHVLCTFNVWWRPINSVQFGGTARSCALRLSTASALRVLTLGHPLGVGVVAQTCCLLLDQST
jgi:hypothetical protein